MDDDDCDHLETVDTKRIEEERQQRMEEMKELREYREKVAAMQEENEDKKLQLIAAKSSKPATKSSTSQKTILTGAIKRKSQSQSESEPASKSIARPSALQTIAVLPGIIGNYGSSDESDSSDLNEEIYGEVLSDLTGRRIKKRKDE